jgi:putative holliday junction resolvase
LKFFMGDCIVVAAAVPLAGRGAYRIAVAMSEAPLTHPADDPGPLIGVDLGSRRIGVAVSDSGVMATPHSVMRNEGDVVQKLANLGRELEASAYVVGIPRRTHASAADRKFHDFAEALRQKSCKPVVLWDESLSTVEAAESLRAAGKRRRDAQKDIDMHAAAVILQSYLDSRHTVATDPGVESGSSS